MADENNVWKERGGRTFKPDTPPGTETNAKTQLNVDLVTHVVDDNHTYTRKSLGQAKVSAATLTDLYTVPASTATLVTAIWATNQSATPTTFRIAVSVAGGAVALKDYLFYDVAIGANEAIQINDPGIMLATTDKLRVYATLATVSFNAFGTEIS